MWYVCSEFGLSISVQYMCVMFVMCGCMCGMLRHMCGVYEVCVEFVIRVFCMWYIFAICVV